MIFMSYQVLVGEKRALVFPVMCHGYLRIDHSDATAIDGTNPRNEHGIFLHDKSITLQTILTPYDINGFGWGMPNLDNPTGHHGIVNSKKTVPVEQSKTYQYRDASNTGTDILESKTQAYNYFGGVSTSNYEMMIFYNTNFQLSLINSTTTNINQPSEYQIKLTVVVDGESDSITSDTVIKASSIPSDVSGFSGAIKYGYDNTGAGAKYEEVTNVTGNTGTTTQLQTGGTEDQTYNLGESLYIRNGQTFTKVATVTSTAAQITSTYVTVVYEAGKSYSDVTSKMLYREADKEALYLLSPFHITASYDVVTGNMAIYLNGSLVKSEIHSNSSGDFHIAAEDTFIGISSDSVLARTRKQFMGELHELAFTSGIVETFNTLDTLIPNYRQTLLYYRFEEVDL